MTDDSQPRPNPAESAFDPQGDFSGRLAQLKDIVAKQPGGSEIAALGADEFALRFGEVYLPYHDEFVRNRGKKEPFPNIRDLAIIGATGVVLLLLRIPFYAFIVLLVLVPPAIYAWARRVERQREQRRLAAKAEVEGVFPGIFSLFPE